MGHRGCIPFSSNHAISPFLFSLIYILQSPIASAPSMLYLSNSRCIFFQGSTNSLIRYCASNASCSFSFVLIQCSPDFQSQEVLFATMFVLSHLIDRRLYQISISICIFGQLNLLPRHQPSLQRSLPVRELTMPIANHR